MQLSDSLTALLDRRGIRVIQINEHIWKVLPPGHQATIFSGRHAKETALDYAERLARELAVAETG